MTFRELMMGMKMPEGADERYRQLEALERTLTGNLYDDLPYSFEQEKDARGRHIPIRDRRPSVDFNLAHEITQDTLAELFGDEQFPIVQSVVNGDQDENATKAIADMLACVELDRVMIEAYEDGVVGSVAIVVRRSAEGTPFFEILPAKWCEPVYRSKYSSTLAALVVTYPISAAQAESMSPGVTEDDSSETFWYRYVIGPIESIDYAPLSDRNYARLGKPDSMGQIIEFVESFRESHGFAGRTPVVWTKNLGGRPRDIDGSALWWPIRNILCEIDYTLSQAGRGLRYSADPMLFVRRGDLYALDDAGGFEGPAAGMATTLDASGAMVKGATQTLVGGPGSDAKLLEISGEAIREEREFIKDLREYSLEILGGQKARADNLSNAASGKALDKGLAPLRRLVRRQRRPYGDALLALVDLTLYGYRSGVFDASQEFDIAAIGENDRRNLQWPNDDTLQGAELLAHVQGVQLAAGGSSTNPIELISPEVMGAKLAADLGFHQPFGTLKGDLEPELAATSTPAAGSDESEE